MYICDNISLNSPKNDKHYRQKLQIKPKHAFYVEVFFSWKIVQFMATNTHSQYVDCVWNAIAHAQKPDFVFTAKRTSPFKSARASVQSTTGSRGVRISGSNVGYTKLLVSEAYWLPTPFATFPFTSPPVRHRVPSHFNWTLILSALPPQQWSHERPRTSHCTFIACPVEHARPTARHLNLKTSRHPALSAGSISFNLLL